MTATKATRIAVPKPAATMKVSGDGVVDVNRWGSSTNTSASRNARNATLAYIVNGFDVPLDAESPTPSPLRCDEDGARQRKSVGPVQGHRDEDSEREDHGTHDVA